MDVIRVGLIEDEELTSVSLRTTLKKYQEIKWVGEAKTGQKGLELLRNAHPDVALVDIGLPDMSGIDLIKQLKHDETIQTKIVILTLHDDETSVLAAFAAGADSYCMKDIRLDLLWEAIKATYEGHAWIDPAIARIILSKTKISREDNSKTDADSDKFLKPNNIRRKDQSHPLTDRELEVLQLIVDGYSNAEIAEELYITVGTVKTHVRNILNKLSADDRTQAAVHALRSGLVG